MTESAADATARERREMEADWQRWMDSESDDYYPDPKKRDAWEFGWELRDREVQRLRGIIERAADSSGPGQTDRGWLSPNEWEIDRILTILAEADTP